MKKVLLAYLVLLTSFANFAQNLADENIYDSVNIENRLNSNFNGFSRRCSGNSFNQRVFEEYGAVFSANSAKVVLPSGCFFKNESEVSQFQKRAGSDSVTIDGVKIVLQPQALKAFLAARAEAQKNGFDITPRGDDASRRSYADTVELWNGRVQTGLEYWVKKGKLTKQEAARIRKLSTNAQISEILKLEESKIYFGKGFGKSILQSVAAPGTSQHILMLALDIEQHANSKVRAILAKYGWFQTVKNDTPHFTYLGLKESDLPKKNLKKVSASGRSVWIPSDGTGDEKPVPNTKGLLKIPTKEIPATASDDVVLTISMTKLLSTLAQRYFERTGKMLHFTSGLRSPATQAKAMYFNLAHYSTEYVAGTYGNSPLAWEIIRAFQNNRDDKEKAISAMTKVITAQVKRKKVISIHLLEKAFDIRSRGAQAANLSVLIQIVRSMGGEVVEEKDHYHVEF